ncbi:enoyl-CoA hydratase/isomerase family protein [Gordonia crocea]|uniref:3-hydroxyisobutyryl-CoA hydrolase n=1 Tax=Gordonia crocea TaxID=589162 RepID=A0A7I9UV83_9ACTN|nr:enoyl-CoA hydratase/isomerase family protein [Gordonia crocea]GED97045.1 enoyl-CoA hydratase [Gordonia crocea]
MSSIMTAVANGVGEIVLNRPKALNALDQEMIDDLTPVLQRWADDPSVATVLVTSGIDRAFCAGGDIRAIRDFALAGDSAAITRYFSSEYTLDQLIANFPKPYVALIDGAAMGGGLGISVHGEVRVVTEKALVAMPETAIGFFPDIGSTYFLPRLPVGVGRWLGLTGARIRGTQAIEVGLATHSVASASVGDLADAIRSGVPLGEALSRFDEAPAADPLPLRAIADYFGGTDSVPAVLGGLRGGDDWAREMAALMDGCSPTSLVVTADMIARGATSSLDQCFDRELHAAEQITVTPDFAEGVRAVLVDKDRQPAFTPASIDDVDPAVVRRIVGD